MRPLEGLIWLSRTLKGNGVKLDVYQGNMEGSREAGKVALLGQKKTVPPATVFLLTVEKRKCKFTLNLSHIREEAGLGVFHLCPRVPPGRGNGILSMSVYLECPTRELAVQ